MLAWILEYAGLKPGYLIGGAPLNFEQSARLGDTPFFVVEADEYDTSYFDRRSKFVHYRPRTLIVNNLEYDHADIFDNIDDIATQFHNLLRTVPETGLVIAPSTDENVNDVLQRGVWTPVARVGEPPGRKGVDMDNGESWTHSELADAGFEVMLNGVTQGVVNWPLLGKHNQANALNAIAAARHAGVPIATAIEALSSFKGVKRRLEVLYDSDTCCVYDDFAHHPTAIRSTLEGLRKNCRQRRNNCSGRTTYPYHVTRHLTPRVNNLLCSSRPRYLVPRRKHQMGFDGNSATVRSTPQKCLITMQIWSPR